jgi:hypothetical protein
MLCPGKPKVAKKTVHWAALHTTGTESTGTGGLPQRGSENGAQALQLGSRFTHPAGKSASFRWDVRLAVGAAVGTALGAVVGTAVGVDTAASAAVGPPNLPIPLVGRYGYRPKLHTLRTEVVTPEVGQGGFKLWTYNNSQ